MPRPLRQSILAALLLLAAAPAAWPETDERRATELNNQAINAAKQGQFDAAADLLRQAIPLNPRDPVLRKNLSGILTDWAVQAGRSGGVDRAQRLLLEAVDHEPANGQAYAMLGDMAYFKRGDFTAAIAYWKQALSSLSPAERRAIAERIAQAQRDQLIERAYVSAQTEHFDIRTQTQGGVPPEALGALLESVYAQLRESLGEGPERVSVIIYTQSDLRRAYNQRDWAIGFYDGRLRMQADEVNAPWGRAFAAHEMTHAFLHHRYGEALPVWLHEGLAQLQEGERELSEEERLLTERLASGADWVPLKWLDRHFTHPSNRDDVIRAYAQARMAAAYLLKRHGPAALQGFLERLRGGDAMEAAYEAAFAPARWGSTDRPFEQLQ